MPLADSYRIEKEAKNDLEAIGGAAMRGIIGELIRLPRLPPSRCPFLAGHREGEPERRRLDIAGAYTARFILVTDANGATVAVVERVFRRTDFEASIAAETAAAEVRSDESEARAEAGEAP